MSSVEAPSPEIIARRVFAEISARFPSLQMVETSGEPVEISISIPVQLGVTHEIWLGLQNRDELHLGVRHFQVGWFPCTKSVKADSYLDAVTGFLSGKYRILEHYRGKRCYRTELQKPEDGEWRTITGSVNIWIPFFRKKTLIEIRNGA